MVLYDEVDEVTWWEKQLGDWGSNFGEHHEGKFQMRAKTELEEFPALEFPSN